jgi:hypothetical protein
LEIFRIGASPKQILEKIADLESQLRQVKISMVDSETNILGVNYNTASGNTRTVGTQQVPCTNIPSQASKVIPPGLHVTHV